MTISDSLKRIGEPFDPRAGFYAITALLFLDTYISIYKNSSLVDFSMNIENIVIYLLLHFACLHLLSPIGRMVVLLIKLFLSRLFVWIIKSDPFEEFKIYPRLTRHDGYHSAYTIANLYQLSNASFLNQLLEKNEQEVKRFQQLQYGYFSFAILLPINYFNLGVIADVLNLSSNDGVIILSGLLVLVLLFLSTADREFKIKLNHNVYKKLHELESRID